MVFYFIGRRKLSWFSHICPRTISLFPQMCNNNTTLILLNCCCCCCLALLVVAVGCFFFVAGISSFPSVECDFQLIFFFRLRFSLFCSFAGCTKRIITRFRIRKICLEKPTTSTISDDKTNNFTFICFSFFFSTWSTQWERDLHA